jgi:NodT family efflux transporter outer membrane factor (OMF) lipoprotein
MILLSGLTTACAPVGPDFVRPESMSNESWSDYVREDFQFDPQDQVEWWDVFNDPVLNELVANARQNNNNIRLAGLAVLEARAALGIARGNRYPQAQFIAGDATRIELSESNANTAGGGDLSYWQYNLGANASWEIDFWGRFRRGIEAADANLLASIASYDDTMVLLTAQVARVYVRIRTAEEQLRIARENLALQQRSYEIVEVLYRFGASSELDVQQAQTLLLSTEATIPDLEIALRQAQHALAALLGLPPTDLTQMLGGEGRIPEVPEQIMVGIPADMLRLRPDVRRAELFAMAQNAQVGVAKADLYPSFSINGSLGVSASGDTDTTRTGDSGIGELFRSESVTYAVGPSFVWPFLNYDRIKNNVRVQDARLQQALVQYQETVIQAAREVEDAMVAFVGNQAQDDILVDTVASARRSTDLSWTHNRHFLTSNSATCRIRGCLSRTLFRCTRRWAADGSRGPRPSSMQQHGNRWNGERIGTICWKRIGKPLAINNDKHRRKPGRTNCGGGNRRGFRQGADGSGAQMDANRPWLMCGIDVLVPGLGPDHAVHEPGARACTGCSNRTASVRHRHECCDNQQRVCNCGSGAVPD